METKRPPLTRHDFVASFCDAFARGLFCVMVFGAVILAVCYVFLVEGLAIKSARSLWYTTLT